MAIQPPSTGRTAPSLGMRGRLLIWLIVVSFATVLIAPVRVRIFVSRVALSPGRGVAQAVALTRQQGVIAAPAAALSLALPAQKQALTQQQQTIPAQVAGL